MSTPKPTRPNDAEFPLDEPSELEQPPDEPTDLSDLDYEDMPCTDDGDDSRWEAFIPDDDEFDPQPDPGDFWFESRLESGTAASRFVPAAVIASGAAFLC